MGHINIEIKAKCADPEAIRKILNSRRADFKGTDLQIDTYFKVNRGRLKLREGKIENHLIYYDREEKAGPRQSNVILFPSQPGSSLKEILTRSLGVLKVVEKEREIYFIGNVKFHLDKVKGRGRFVEIEAIGKDGTIGKEKLLKQCRSFLELFKIPKKDLITASYGDLV